MRFYTDFISVTKDTCSCWYGSKGFSWHSRYNKRLFVSIVSMRIRLCLRVPTNKFAALEYVQKTRGILIN